MIDAARLSAQAPERAAGPIRANRAALTARPVAREDRSGLQARARPGPDDPARLRHAASARHDGGMRLSLLRGQRADQGGIGGFGRLLLGRRIDCGLIRRALRLDDGGQRLRGV